VYYKLTVGSYISLFSLLIIWYGIVSPPQYILSGIFTVLFIGLLLLPARDLFRKNPRVYMWSSYLILIYFSHAIIESWANDTERFYALAELLLSGVYFVGATLCYRQTRKQHSKDTA
jgi:uncharacterized membrane protein